MKTEQQSGVTGMSPARWRARPPELTDPVPAGLGRRPEPKNRPAAGWKPGEVTILLAEDNPEMKTMLEMFLRREGYTVLGAQNGIEALGIHDEHDGPIHLLVTDVMMPEMGGIELAERIQPLRPGMSVLYISGYPGEMSRYLGLSAPGRGFLKKPFRLHEMDRAIRFLLDGGREPPLAAAAGSMHGY